MVVYNRPTEKKEGGANFGTPIGWLITLAKYKILINIT